MQRIYTIYVYSEHTRDLCDVDLNQLQASKISLGYLFNYVFTLVLFIPSVFYILPRIRAKSHFPNIILIGKVIKML